LKQRYVEFAFPAEPLLLICRHVQIETVLVNLIENAIKYSPADSPLTIGGEPQGKQVFCFVRDRGPGLKPEDMNRIFEKFVRAEFDQPRKGTGLGLAICRAIVTEHRGQIGASNARGGGAEFWFSLPAIPRSGDSWR